MSASPGINIVLGIGTGNRVTLLVEGKAYHSKEICQYSRLNRGLSYNCGCGKEEKRPRWPIESRGRDRDNVAVFQTQTKLYRLSKELQVRKLHSV
jgi:hypothetical protein